MAGDRERRWGIFGTAGRTYDGRGGPRSPDPDHLSAEGDTEGEEAI